MTTAGCAAVLQARADKLALGTVQFGLRYGVANQAGQVSRDAVGAILGLAKQCGVDTLDTAVAYGSSEDCLGRIGVAGWRVITKLPPLPSGVQDVRGWVSEQAQASLRRLKLTRLEALLVHQSADLSGPNAAALRDALASLKAQGIVAAAGVSIYDPSELAGLWGSWRPDVVQAPYNVFDQRLIRTGWLSRLSSSGIRVHLRSAFLQGLLLMSPERQPAYFARWNGLLVRWRDWCVASGSTPLSAALAAVLAVPGVERVVVGVDSLAQLKQLLATLAAAVPLPPASPRQPLRAQRRVRQARQLGLHLGACCH